MHPRIRHRPQRFGEHEYSGDVCDYHDYLLFSSQSTYTPYIGHSEDVTERVRRYRSKNISRSQQQKVRKQTENIRVRELRRD
tara:strand:+ start:3194 stop:3439 length:246 start_codon:yes stop_codon:yes gene_type:complete